METAVKPRLDASIACKAGCSAAQALRMNQDERKKYGWRLLLLLLLLPDATEPATLLLLLLLFAGRFFGCACSSCNQPCSNRAAAL
jgi:hypothetical protein